MKLMEENEEASLDGSSIMGRGRKNSRSSSRSMESINSQMSVDDDKDEKEKSNSPEQAENVEESSKGKANGNVLYNYIKAGAPNILYMFFLFLLFVLTQFLASAADFWVSFWTSQEELRAFYLRGNGSDVTASTIELVSMNATETELPIHDERLDSLLSTEMCMYIHGALVISLFFVAIFR